MEIPRPPSVDHGVLSFLWAFGLGLYIWLGLIAVGVSKGPAFIFAVVAAAGIFLFVRLYGEEEVRKVPRQRGSSTRGGA